MEGNRECREKKYNERRVGIGEIKNMKKEGKCNEECENKRIREQGKWGRKSEKQNMERGSIDEKKQKSKRNSKNKKQKYKKWNNEEEKVKSMNYKELKKRIRDVKKEKKDRRKKRLKK